MQTLPPSASIVGNLTTAGCPVSRARTPSPLLYLGEVRGFFIQLAGRAMALSAGLTAASARNAVAYSTCGASIHPASKAARCLGQQTGPQFTQHLCRPFIERLCGGLRLRSFIVFVPSVAVSSLMTSNHKGQSRCVTISEQKTTNREKS